MVVVFPQLDTAAMATLLSSRANIACTRPLQASASRSCGAARSPLQVEARVAIRFSRFGRKKAPVYRIIAIDSRKRREGRPLEWLGYYNPISKEVNLDAPNIKKWYLPLSLRYKTNISIRKYKKDRDNSQSGKTKNNGIS